MPKIGGLVIVAVLVACTASGTDDERALEPSGSDSDAGASILDAAAPPEDAAASDADADAGAEPTLICGDAGFCETKLPMSDSGTPLSLRGVWVVGSNDVWSVSLEGFVLHYDGAQWNIEFRAGHELYSVWATSNHVWVGGEGGILLHRDASRQWALVDVGHIAPIHAIYGTGDDDVWFTREDASIDHFDGTMVTNQPSGIDGLEITTVFGRLGVGTYAAGRVRPVFTTSGSVPDQPYVLALSTSGMTIFNTSLTTLRGFSPLSGFVADSPPDGPKVFLVGYNESRTVQSGVLVRTLFNIKYTVFDVDDTAAIKTFVPVSIQPPLGLYPEWRIGAWVRSFSDIQLLPNTANVLRWNGQAFTVMPLAMGYEHPFSTAFAAHNAGTDAWVVGNGFALKGAMP